MCVFHLLILGAILMVASVCGTQKSFDCRSQNAGIYYLYLQDKSSNYGWYSIMQLRSDGSTLFVGSDQQSLEAETTSEAIAQPYSGSLGKWTCKRKSRKTIQIRITSYNFEYPTSGVPQGNFVNVAKLRLNFNSKTKIISGTATGRFLNLTTKLLGRDVEVMKEDVVAGPLTVDVHGYLAERYRI